jgi:YfiH family protein
VNELWIPADWQAPPGVVAGCTTRVGGSSDGIYASLNLGAHVGDDPAAVAENRRRFKNICDLPSEPRWLNQVHGAGVARDPDVGTEADAGYTASPDMVCVVMVADCLPVLFASADGREIAAAHAGWRGLAAGVLENTIAEFAAPAGEIRAWLGPAISAPEFEVGDEVRDAFCIGDDAATACFRRNDRGRWQADLYELARQRLGRAGVTDISDGGLCTCRDRARFFSYRRDGQCGRMAAFVFRRGDNA